jgi:hypothetical protein
MKDFTYKTTAVALQSRRLVAVSRKGGGWTAVRPPMSAYSGTDLARMITGL